MKQISGNKLLVRALKEEGVDTIFGYPGACTIDISDELYKQDDIRIILPRHEQALVHEADAYARTTGKVYVGAFVCMLFILGLFIVKGPMKWAMLLRRDNRVWR